MTGRVLRNTRDSLWTAGISGMNGRKLMISNFAHNGSSSLAPTSQAMRAMVYLHGKFSRRR